MEREAADNERVRSMVEAYGDAIVRMCFLYLRDRALAEDAAQDCFFKAWRGLKSFRGGSSEKTWLMRIAINTCRDYRRRSWLRQVDQSASVEDMGLSAPVSDLSPDDTVLQAVMRLPAKAREVILLRYYQEMKLSEISEVLGVPEGTVTSRLNRARARLRACLEGWYFDEDVPQNDEREAEPAAYERPC